MVHGAVPRERRVTSSIDGARDGLAPRVPDMRFCGDDLPRRRRGQWGPTMLRTTMRRTTMLQIGTCKGLTIAAALTLVPTAAFAHPGIGEMHGFTHGFAHPLGGLDHI